MACGSRLVVICLGIAPYYAISELLFGIYQSPDRTWCDVTDRVSSRDPTDLKSFFALY